MFNRSILPQLLLVNSKDTPSPSALPHTDFKFSGSPSHSIQSGERTPQKGGPPCGLKGRLQGLSAD